MSSPILTTVVCAAPAAFRIDDFVRAAQATGWTVQLALTPSAAAWLDVDHLTRVTGHPVQITFRRPDEPRALQGDAIAVVPATFNTVNKWAAGVNDSSALGILNEALGLGLPIVVAPFAKDLLTSHPAFSESVRRLSSLGVTFLPVNIVEPVPESGEFAWGTVLEALPGPSGHRHS